ncbi:MAG TPA: metallophosphoesterase [Chloroflexia bacterium]|nr:metallophosphoesterase [Chloroflexia bacterium]
MSSPNPVFIVGDIHGQFDKMVGLLRQAGLVSPDLHWSGGKAVLWFMGDFFDRGPDGIGAVELAIRLQHEAAQVGGRVNSLIGNHEALIMSARLFGERVTGWGGTFKGDWERNGGRASDLKRLEDRHMRWLSGLPAMAREGDRLLIHADSLLYCDYGLTWEKVNAAFRAILTCDVPQAWDRLLEQFGDRLAFMDPDIGPSSITRDPVAARFLEIFGGRQVVHGHTPIGSVTGVPHDEVTGPLVYASGMCVNVDGGMYRGGPGFVYELPPLESVPAHDVSNVATPGGA